MPPFLEKGDRIAMISPSSFIDPELIAKTSDILWDWGYEPVVGPNVGKSEADKYAGTPKERAEDIIWAFTDPSIKAVLCNRGGYGAIHLAELIPDEVFTASPKWLVGFSDITVLHSMSVSAGVMSIHGTMPSLIATESQDQLSIELLRRLLGGEVPSYTWSGGEFLKKGKAEGILVGGNICTFAPLLLSDKDFTKKDDIILFIEDVDETFHNIDRQWHMLKFSGALDRVKGIILGEFTDCTKDLGYESIEKMLWERYLKNLDIPVCSGFPVGHGKTNVPLIEGAPVKLTVKEGCTSLSFGLDADSIEVSLD